MEAKELQNRLDIIRLAATIGDLDTIILQTTHLRKLNEAPLNEIISLLESKNYRQALYLIKRYMNENSLLSSDTLNNFDDESEKVLDVEDMLRMSPLAKETIKEYKRSHYTKDDLEAFAKNIEVPVQKEYEKIETNTIDDYEEKIQEIQEGIEQNPINEELEKKKEEEKANLDEYDSAIENVDKDTPLDEISAEVLGVKEDSGSKKVLSKYKTLRSKFAKKDKKESKEKKEGSSLTKAISSKFKTLDIKNSINKVKAVKSSAEDIKKEEPKEIKEPKEQKEDTQIKQEQSSNEIYPPIPHIEQKFRQAFVLYPPNKESDVWIEEVIKFLKLVSTNSYTESDVKTFLNEYQFYLKKGDIARAAQVLLLAASTDSKYAKFILARELFNGRVLKRDLKKSFVLMKSLANEFYPDAVCDLGQFYEYGIGVPKNKKVALKLYEKAFELGVDRATKHINRIKESGGILSSLLRF